MSSHHCSLTLDLMTGRHILTFPRPAALQQFGWPLSNNDGVALEPHAALQPMGSFLATGRHFFGP